MTEPADQVPRHHRNVGAGRRSAAHTLEDLGWYVADNLPPTMLPTFVDVAAAAGYDRVAVVLDVRTRSSSTSIPAPSTRCRPRASCRRSCSSRRPTP
jgi:RNase adaptor protein for sRNA GlmZ degradation